ncbi:MAG: phosphotransferase [Roseiflexaceae bacterium]
MTLPLEYNSESISLLYSTVKIMALEATYTAKVSVNKGTQYKVARILLLHKLTVLRSDDIVHGDLAVDNVLVVGAVVSGIVDWDAAGNGTIAERLL